MHRVLPNVTLTDDKYYLPSAPNNSLFASFTIDVDETTAAISLFQTVDSSNHPGSVDCYHFVPKIVKSVRELLEEQGIDMEIRAVYFLVCLEDESGPNWRCPQARTRPSNQTTTAEMPTAYTFPPRASQCIVSIHS